MPDLEQEMAMPAAGLDAATAAVVGSGTPSVAGATVSALGPAGRVVGVLGGEGVSVDALGFESPTDVVANRDRLKVSRVDAGAIAAEMVKGQAGRNGADQK